MSSPNITYYDPKSFADAIDWLKSIGIRISSDRLNTTLKLYNNSKKTDLTPDEVWAISDLDDIIHIYNEFKDQNLPKEIIDIIEKIPSGKIFLSEEKIDGSSDKGRDFCFELNIISLFSKMGALPKFESNAEFNIELSWLGEHIANIFFECKRPKISNSIRRNTIDSMKQIEKRGGIGDVGVSCLSLNRILWDKMNGKILRGKVSDIPNHVLKLMSSELSKIRNIHNFNYYAKTILIISEFKCPFIDDDTNELLFFRHHDFNLRYYEEHTRPPYSREFMHRAAISLILLNSIQNEYKS
ncbi:hypothetical protein AB7Z54_20935 [Providencia manganoxydans]|uniref:hypothetical protein n=1 Tax=Providencia manganoxydans TaxID=2923283 RepID=UPI0032DAB813